MTIAHPTPEESNVVATKDLLRQVQEAVDGENTAQLKELLDDLHPADTAEVIEKLDPVRREGVVQFLKTQFDIEVLLYLSPYYQQEVIEVLGFDRVARMLTSVGSDDALTFVEELDDDFKTRLFASLTAKQRAMIEESLTYEEGSAGRLMQREVVALPAHWRVKDTLNFIKTSYTLPNQVYKIYVIDKQHKPLGHINVSDLLRSDPQETLQNIMEEANHVLTIHTPQKEALYVFRHYALDSAPVVDDAGHLIGVITLENIVDLIDEEAEREIYGLTRATGSDFQESTYDTFQSRLRWLVFTAINSCIASYTVAQFDRALQSKVALAILMSIVATMGGTVGMQVSAVSIRALGTQELRPGFILKPFLKETTVALLTGLVLAVLLGGISYVWFWEAKLSVIFAVSVLFNMVWSGVVGILVPITLDRFGFDPAISAGTFVIMAADILGYVAFLGLATALII